jgi:hypothetical protein
MAQAKTTSNRRKSAASNRKRATASEESLRNAAAARKAAVAGTKAAGRAVSTAASRAKTPLITGAAALAGLVGGRALLDRSGGDSASRAVQNVGRQFESWRKGIRRTS